MSIPMGQHEMRARTPGLSGLSAAAMTLSICVLSQGFLSLGRSDAAAGVMNTGESDPWANVLQGFALVVVLCGAAANMDRVRTTLRVGLAQWPIWSFCVLSAAWSCSPGTTLRRSLLLLAYFVFGHYAYAIAGVRGTLRQLNVASWVMIACSLALFVFLPHVGQDVGSYQGALRGIFWQKNVTAWALQLSLAYLGYRIYADRTIGIGLVLGVPIIIAAIVLTRSTTELLGCALLIAFWIWSAWFRAARLKLLPLWAAAAVLAAVAFALWGLGDDAYRIVGKDPGLTGREQIWALTERAIAARPLLGHGFQGFWRPDEREVQEIWAVLLWPTPHAHNGLLELLIETGFVGLALYGLLIGRLLILVVRGLARDSAEAWWTLSWMILVVLKAHDEPIYLQLDMSMALMSFSMVALGMQQRQYDSDHARATTPATASRAGLGWSASS